MGNERKTPEGDGSAEASSSLHAFRFDHTGIRRVLGPLEADVLEAVWRLTPESESGTEGWTTIGAVRQGLGPNANYKTIQTIMNRLVEKHLLIRRQHRRAYEYRALPTRSMLEESVAHNVLEGLMRDFGPVAIVQLVQAVQEVQPEHLALLERLAADAQRAVTTQVASENAETRSAASDTSQSGRRHPAQGNGDSTADNSR